MRRSRLWTDSRRADDEGSASLEFITVGLILLVPLVYLVLAMASIQAGALAAEGAARQAARVFVQAGSVATAHTSAGRAVEFALADHGLRDAASGVAVSCRPQPGDCLTRQGFVTVTVDLRIPLPLLPPAIIGDLPLSVPLQATATQQVSRFWGSG
jgi:hypothetical protein